MFMRMPIAPTPPSRAGTQDLTTGPIVSTLAVFALPVLGSNVLQSLNGSVNAVWVGRFLGEEALTATSNANLVLFLLLGTIFGFGMAATILVAQAIGARDLRRARQVVGTSAVLFAIISALFAVGGYLMTSQILGWLGTPADAVPLAERYLKVIFVAVPALNFLSFLMTVLRGAGDSRTPFLFMALAVGLDVVLNPILIRGFGPAPELGIAGAAASTLIAQTIGLVALLITLYVRKHPLRLAGADLAFLKPDWTILKTIVVKGVPMGLQMIVISASALVLMGLVNGYGSQVAAAYGVSAQLWTYVQMPALAIGAAVSTMTAQNVGADRWDRVGQITRAGILFNIALTGGLVLGLYFADRAALGLFLASDSGAVDIAAHINAAVAWSFVLFGVTIVLFATVRATGAVLPPLIILVISVLLGRVGVAYGLRPLFGAEAIWWSFSVSSALSLILAGAYYRFGGWRQERMVAAGRPAAGEPPDTGLGVPRGRAIHQT